MRAVLAILLFSLREHSRRKLVAFFGLGSVLLTGVLLYLAPRVPGGPGGELLAEAASVQGLPFFVLLAALAVSMNNIGPPFHSGEVQAILARPVSRWQFALGRLGASVAAVAGLCLLLAAELQVVALVEEGSFVPRLWGHWGATAFALTVVAAVTTLVSCAVTAPVLAAVVGFLVHQVVGPVALGHRLVQEGAIRGGLARLVETLWYLTPKYLRSPLQGLVVSGSERFAPPSSPGMVAWGVAYLVAVVAAVLVATERKEA